MRYYRRPWDESRGDEHDDWGTSVWFFEVGNDSSPVRQMEVYAGGQVLQYDAGHMDDAFGGLGDQPLEHDDFAAFEISRAAFEQAWSRHSPLNR